MIWQSFGAQKDLFINNYDISLLYVYQLSSLKTWSALQEKKRTHARKKKYLAFLKVKYVNTWR